MRSLKGWVTWALGIGIGLRILSILLQLLRYEEFGFTELVFASFAMIWSRGQQPYQDFTQAPVPIGHYGPLAYFWMAQLGRIFGAAYNPQLFMTICRLVIFLFLTGSIWIFYRIAKDKTRDTALSLLALTLFLAGPWINLGIRPDWQAMLFNLGALAVLLRAGLFNKKVGAGVGLLLAITLLHKHTFASLAFTLLLHLLTRKKFGEIFWVFGSLALALIALYTPFYLFSHGWILNHQRVLAMAFRDYSRIPQFISTLPQAGPFFFLLMVLAALFRPKAAGAASDSWIDAPTFLQQYAFIATFLNLLLLLFPGAAVNHLLEPAAALALSASWGFFHWLSREQTPSAQLRPRWMVPCTMLVLALFPLKNLYDMGRDWRAELLGRRGKYDLTVGIENQLATLPPGPLLSERPAVAYKTNRPEYAFESFLYIDVLPPKSLFSWEPTREKIRQRYYRCLVLSEKDSGLLKILRDDIVAHYDPQFTLRGLTIWYPKTPG